MLFIIPTRINIYSSRRLIYCIYFVCECICVCLYMRTILHDYSILISNEQYNIYHKSTLSFGFSVFLFCPFIFSI